jgi:hypothetical protein
MIKKRNREGMRVETPTSSLIEQPKKEITTLSSEDIKTYKDEVIVVLDILEKQGIDIYDPNNKPGMYLSETKKSSIPKNLTQKLQESTKNKSQENLDFLFQQLRENHNNHKQTK